MSLAAWMETYVRAWTSNQPEDIADLFTEDAVYDPQTSGDTWEGRAEIIEGWQEIGDRPGTWTFEWEPLVDRDDLGIIVGRTEYSDDDAKTYRNLWVMRFAADHRCTEFTEWWVEEDW
jgi:hypothetical protein